MPGPGGPGGSGSSFDTTYYDVTKCLFKEVHVTGSKRKCSGSGPSKRSKNNKPFKPF